MESSEPLYQSSDPDMVAAVHAEIYAIHEEAVVRNVREQLTQEMDAEESTPHLDKDQQQALIDNINLRLKEGILERPEDPKSIKHALEHPIFGPLWKAECFREYRSMESKQVWEVMERLDLPLRSNVMRSIWAFVYKFKFVEGIGTQLEKLKARLCAAGTTQKPGVDYFLTHSPVIKHESIRGLLAIAATQRYKIWQYDAIGAYLNAPVEEEVYMELPRAHDGVPHKTDRKRYILHLLKSLYGMKQSGRNWYNALVDKMLELGFIQSRADNCVFRHPELDLIIGVYVDDFIVLYKTVKDRDYFFINFSKSYKLEDRGPLKWLLGMEVQQYEDFSISIKMEKYIDETIQRFGLQNATPSRTPVETSYQFATNTEDNAVFQKNTPYRELAGAILFIMVCQRPTIAFAIGACCRYMSNFNSSHWKQLKHILRYLKGTKNHMLWFKNSGHLDISAFTDAAHADEITYRKSTGGYIIYWGTSPIIWRSKLLGSIAQSSCEAEYVILTECAKATRAQALFQLELGISTATPRIFEDNQGAIALTENFSNKPRTKHLELRHHFVRQLVMQGMIKIFYCPTQLQLADCMTKQLPERACNDHYPRLMGETTDDFKIEETQLRTVDFRHAYPKPA